VYLTLEINRYTKAAGIFRGATALPYFLLYSTSTPFFRPSTGAGFSPRDFPPLQMSPIPCCMTTWFAIFDFLQVLYWNWHKFEVRIALTILELLTLSAPKCTGHVTLATLHLRAKFFRDMSELSLGACTPNFKSIDVLELLAKYLRCHVTVAMLPFRKEFQGSFQDCLREHDGQIWSPYL